MRSQSYIIVPSAPLEHPLNAPQLLRKYNLHPRHKLGQNFLMSASALQAIVSAAELSEQDRVLEVGPGLGVLTEQLTSRAGCVVALELDQQLVQVLRTELGDTPNLRVVEGDILRVDHTRLMLEHCPEPGAYKVVANLPYYLTSHAIRRFMELAPRPELTVVMVQLEVAQRAVAEPPEANLLGLAVQLYAVPRVMARVPAAAFLPKPDVDSAVLQLRTRSRPLFPGLAEERILRLAAAGFGQKRKQLANSLASNLHVDKREVATCLDRAGLEPGVRAQELSLEQWAELCRLLCDA